MSNRIALVSDPLRVDVRKFGVSFTRVEYSRNAGGIKFASLTFAGRPME